jgi:hypothetical protein
MATEIEEHKIVHDSLDEIFPLIRAAKADHAKFDGPKMKGILEKLKDPLVRIFSTFGVLSTN